MRDDTSCSRDWSNDFYEISLITCIIYLVNKISGDPIYNNAIWTWKIPTFLISHPFQHHLSESLNTERMMVSRRLLTSNRLRKKHLPSLETICFHFRQGFSLKCYFDSCWENGRQMTDDFFFGIHSHEFSRHFKQRLSHDEL